ncbi:MAG: sulfite exporter TauE/SafE family protein [Gammaproteobacteria bacterium]|nr:sulfite exporter TauE/SafE family protein [Gammaproteobacteria bacterium]
MTEYDVGLVIAAWLVGLAGGSGHCIGMCGGIVGALGVGHGSGWSGLVRLAAAHLGRVSSYALAGALVGFVGVTFVRGIFGPNGIVAMRVAAAVLILAIGLQLLLGRPLLTRLEQAGSRFWRVLAPQMRKLLPPRDPLRAFGVGTLWGWLPCGLVYSELAVAAASGGPTAGALVMGSFGLGTIVSLSAVSVLLHSLGIARIPRQASGALLILFAIWTVLPFLPGAGPQH